MKLRVFWLLAIFMAVSTYAFSQTQGIQYQAVVRDTNGAILQNDTISVGFLIHQDSLQGATIFREEHQNIVTNEFGLVNLVIGTGTPTTGSFGAIDWSNQNLWVEVEMDVLGASSFTSLGGFPFQTVPYAYHAITADSIDDADADPLNEIQQISILNDTITLSLNGGSFSVKNYDQSSDVVAINSKLISDSTFFQQQIDQIQQNSGQNQLRLDTLSARMDTINKDQQALFYNDVSGTLSLSNSPDVDLSNLRDSVMAALIDSALSIRSTINGLSFPTDTLSIIKDSDGNTSISLEETSNDDLIRFSVNGIEKMKLDSNTLHLGSGSAGVFVGQNAGMSNTSGNENTAFGSEALMLVETGNSNTGIGTIALKNNTGSFNTAVGAWALTKNLSGNSNTAMGRMALREIENGSGNSAFGHLSLVELINGGSNVAVGETAGQQLLLGSGNTFIGSGSGSGNTNGNLNVFLGLNSGANEVGSNKLYIENSNSLTPLIWGDFANDSLKVFGTFGIRNEYVFPSLDGTNNQVLTTDGNGQLSFQDAKTQNLTLLGDSLLIDDANGVDLSNYSLRIDTANQRIASLQIELDEDSTNFDTLISQLQTSDSQLQTSLEDSTANIKLQTTNNLADTASQLRTEQLAANSQQLTALSDTATAIRSSLSTLDLQLSSNLADTAAQLRTEQQTANSQQLAALQDSTTNTRAQLADTSSTLRALINGVSAASGSGLVDTAQAIRTSLSELDSTLSTQINVVDSALRSDLVDSLSTLDFQLSSNLADTASQLRTEQLAANSQQLSALSDTASDIRTDLADSLSTLDLQLSSNLADTASQLRTEQLTANSQQLAAFQDSTTNTRAQLADTASTLRALINGVSAASGSGLVDTAQAIRTSLSELDSTLSTQINVVDSALRSDLVDSLSTLDFQLSSNLADTASQLRTEQLTANSQQLSALSDTASDIRADLADSLSNLNLQLSSNLADTASQLRTDQLTANSQQLTALQDSTTNTRAQLADTSSTLRALINGVSAASGSGLTDTAQAIRSSLGELDSTLSTQINFNDSAIRADLADSLSTLDLQLSSNLADTASQLRTDQLTANSQQLTALQDSTTNTRALLADSTSQLRTELQTANSQQLTALSDTASDIRASIQSANNQLLNKINSDSTNFDTLIAGLNDSLRIKMSADSALFETKIQGANSDNQNLSLNGDTLFITDGDSVNLSAFNNTNQINALTNKVNQDSTTLRSVINTNFGNIGNNQTDIANLTAKQANDSLVLSSQINVVDSALRNDLVDSLSTLNSQLSTKINSDSTNFDTLISQLDNRRKADSTLLETKIQGANSDNQSLSLNGDTLFITDGDSVNLNVFRDTAAIANIQQALEDSILNTRTLQQSALSDTATAIRFSLSTLDSQLSTNITDSTTNTRALLADSTSQLRTELQTANSQQLSALSDTATAIRSSLADSSQTLRGLISSSGSDDQNLTFTTRRLSIEDGNTVDLRSLSDSSIAANIDSSAALRTALQTANSQQLSALSDTATAIRLSLTDSSQTLRSLISSSGSDNQTLSLINSNRTLSIEDGNDLDVRVLSDSAMTALSDTASALRAVQLTANSQQLSALSDTASDIRGDLADSLSTLDSQLSSNLADTASQLRTEQLAANSQQLTALQDSTTNTRALLADSTSQLRIELQTANSQQLSALSDTATAIRSDIAALNFETDTLPLIKDVDGNTFVTVTNTADNVDIFMRDTLFSAFERGRLAFYNNGESVFIGQGAGLKDNFSGNENVFVGFNSGTENTSGAFNTFLGSTVGESNTTGSLNTFIGQSSGFSNTSGERNTFIGGYAGFDNITSSNNTFVGYNAGSVFDFGNNTMIGSGAGEYADGIGNTFLGYNSGLNLLNGDSNIFIGPNAGGTQTTIHNKLFIDVTDTDNPLIWGDFAKDSLKVYGTLSIGNAFTFPTADGTNGQVLTTDGSGVLSFQDFTSTDDQILTLNNSRTLTIEDGNTIDLRGLSDSAMTALSDTSTALRAAQLTANSQQLTALSDTATAIRLSLSTLDAQLSTNITDSTTNTRALLADSTSQLRTELQTANSQQLSALSDTATAIRTALIDSSAAIRSAISGAGDNLGDHSATTNVQLNGNFLSNDGDNEGLQIDNSGRTSLAGNPQSDTRLYIEETTLEKGISVIQNDASVARAAIKGEVTGANGTEAYALEGEATSGATNNYGIHAIATGTGGTNYGVFGKAINGTTNYAGYFDEGNVYMRDNLGIGTLNPNTRLDVSSTTFLNTTLRGANTNGTWLNIGNDDTGGRYYKLISTGTGNGKPGMLLIGFGDVENTTKGVALAIDSNSVGIGTNPSELLDVAGMATIDSLNINSAFTFPSTDGANGQVLQTDGSGTVTWENAATDTDDQTLSLTNSNRSLTIADGNSIDVRVLADTSIQANIDSSAALRTALQTANSQQLSDLSDTATAIRASLSTLDAQLSTNLTDSTTNTRALLADSTSQLRTELQTTSSQQLSALSDTATAIRSSLSTLDAQLSTNLTDSTANTRSQLGDTASTLRGLITASGDNLGDHTATQNLQLNGNFLSNDGDAEGVVIDNDGNIGLNTTPNPNTTLSIKENSSNLLSFVDSNNTGTWDFSGNDNFFTISESNTAPRMTLNKGGHVGFNTSSKVSDETVTINSPLNQWGWINTAGGVSLGTWMYSNAGQIGTFSNHRLEFITNNSVARMVIDTNGRIAIGANPVDNKFRVFDNFQQTSGGYEASEFFSAGTATSGAFQRSLVSYIEGTDGDNAAIFGMSRGTSSGRNIGVVGRAENGSENIGVRGQATSTITGKNYGIFATAANADTNYAAYFANGLVYVADTLVIPTNASNGRVLTSDVNGFASWADLSSLSGSSPWDLYSGNTRAFISEPISIGGRSSSNALTIFSDSLTTNGLVQYGTSGFFNTATFRNSDVDQRVSVGLSDASLNHSFAIGTYKNSSWSNPFVIQLGAPTETMVIDSTGNVGIGTNTPSEELVVIGTTILDTLNINNQFTLPSLDGTNGQVLQTDGSGTVTWENAATDTDDQTLSLTNARTLSIADGNSVDVRVLSDSAIAANIDSSAAIRSSLSTLDAQLSTNLTDSTTNTRALLADSTAQLRTELQTANSQQLSVLSDTASALRTAISNAGDDLGNHTATTTLNLGGNYLSGDGDAEGVHVDADGDVTIGSNKGFNAFSVWKSSGNRNKYLG